MSIINLRLPDDLAKRLALEAQLAKRPRSEIARAAIENYLDRRERERFLANMEAAASALAEDPTYRNEAIRLAEEFLPVDNETLALGERRTDLSSSEARSRRKRKTS